MFRILRENTCLDIENTRTTLHSRKTVYILRVQILRQAPHGVTDLWQVADLNERVTASEHPARISAQRMQRNISEFIVAKRS